jgi:peptidoglycan/xylan/chitin deacetylase (PgdA/CDA1 family)
VFAKAEKKKIPILMYHSISEYASVKFRPFAVSPELFAKHMAYLHLHAYTPITITQFVHALTKREAPLPDQPVVLTFDDGYADFFTKALPVLQQYNFTATLYIPTGFIGGTSRWLQHEGEATRPMLTWDQVTEISASGIECGGHSHWHRQLNTLPLAQARDEIVCCKRLLEDHLGQEVSTFAYPYGAHSTIIRRLVQGAGYTSACAVKNEVSSEATDPFALARLTVSADTGLDALAMLLSKRSSPVIVKMYARIKASVLQLARCGSASMMRY